MRSNTDVAGQQILPAEKLPALHTAVVKQCRFDRDGHRTASVRVRPGEPTLRAGYRYRCLPDPAAGRHRAEVLPWGDDRVWGAAVQRWHVLRLRTGVEVLGGDAARRHRGATGHDGRTARSQRLPEPLYPQNPPASFTLADVQFTVAEYLRGEGYAQYTYNATNPDLRAFTARGGKLILYHGLA